MTDQIFKRGDLVQFTERFTRLNKKFGLGIVLKIYKPMGPTFCGNSCGKAAKVFFFKIQTIEERYCFALKLVSRNSRL